MDVRLALIFVGFYILFALLYTFPPFRYHHLTPATSKGTHLFASFHIFTDYQPIASVRASTIIQARGGEKDAKEYLIREKQEMYETEIVGRK